MVCTGSWPNLTYAELADPQVLRSHTLPEPKGSKEGAAEARRAAAASIAEAPAFIRLQADGQPPPPRG